MAQPVGRMNGLSTVAASPLTAPVEVTKIALVKDVLIACATREPAKTVKRGTATQTVAANKTAETESGNPVDSPRSNDAVMALTMTVMGKSMKTVCVPKTRSVPALIPVVAAQRCVPMVCSPAAQRPPLGKKSAETVSMKTVMVNSMMAVRVHKSARRVPAQLRVIPTVSKPVMVRHLRGARQERPRMNSVTESTMTAMV